MILLHFESFLYSGIYRIRNDLFFLKSFKYIPKSHYFIIVFKKYGAYFEYKALHIGS
ncbi:hypothetical protein LEP1GSC133_3010 [Leptospira borgpetersenii serovar Pomona str. 200901868]|uniref:Uncharacterized protein n=1 Tax=Leptospira borgpetersenii serovar Pomona str. 200901868 TaxID=1192866 RepID=M6WHI3_LEPBO|nr:hypothetical protein LEP1GSC133_3010 [Leptospira borgpetersenii serovar Pomona str. 200901868]